MTVPQFTLKGQALDLLDTDDPTALHSITLTPNTRGQVVSINGVLYRPEPITVELDEDGKLNGNTGIDLLANDPSVDLSEPLQWQVRVNTTEGFPRQPKPFWFTAGDDGEIVQLGDVSPAPLVEPQGLTRGPRGVDEVVGIDGEIEFRFQGEPVGDPISLSGLVTVGWDEVIGKPTVIAAGATQADARNAIGAGTSNLAIGTTGSTAKAGNYTPTGAEVIAGLGFTPEDASKKNAQNGFAGLDASGLVPSSLLPGFVDDVIEGANLAAFPATGQAGKLYVALDTSKVYRWSGSTYIEVSPSPGSTDAVPEGTVNLYHTDARAQAANSVALSGKEPTITAGTTGQYWRGDKSWQTLDKAAVGLSAVNNTADLSKPISTATQTALDAKAAVVHTHVTSDVTGLDSALDGKANTSHSHAQSDVTGLTAALDGKQPLSTNLTSFAGKTAPSGAVVGTTDAQALTNKDLSGAGNTFPTFNQNTTGSASRLTTPRTINGIARFDGTANITTNNTGWMPSDYGWLAWNFDIATVIASGSAVNGTLYLTAINIPAQTTISNVILGVGVQAITPTSGQNFAALYQGGSLLAATADQSSNWTSIGVKVMPLTAPQTISAGVVYVAVFANAGTPPAFLRGTNLSAVVNGALTNPNLRFAQANTSLTTAMPASYGTQTTTGNAYWAAVS